MPHNTLESFVSQSDVTWPGLPCVTEIPSHTYFSLPRATPFVTMKVNTENSLPALVLLGIFFLALDSMWGGIMRNGYYDAMVHIRDVGPHLLPGSDTPIQEEYTGLGVLDYWLMVLQTVFANVTDGSAPELSLYAFQFAGQLVPVITCLLIESMRGGNRGTYFFI